MSRYACKLKQKKLSTVNHKWINFISTVAETVLYLPGVVYHMYGINNCVTLYLHVSIAPHTAELILINTSNIDTYTSMFGSSYYTIYSLR